VPLAALVLVALWTFHGAAHANARRRILVATGAFLVAALAFYLYWRSVPGLKAFDPKFPNKQSLRVSFYRSAGLLRLLGLVLTPLVVLCRPDRIIRRAWTTSSALSTGLLVGAGGWLAYTAYAAPKIAFTGNYVVPDGALSIGVSTGTRPDIISLSTFRVLTLVGTASALVLVLAAVPALADAASRVRFRDLTPADPASAFLGVALAGYAAAYVAAAFVQLPLYDRYILPMVPLAALLLVNRYVDERVPITRLPSGAPAPQEFLSPPDYFVAPLSPSRKVAGGLALAVLLGLGLLYAADSASFDGVRWAVAAEATRTPIASGSDVTWKPRDIGGSFEWVNYYSARPGTGARLRGDFCVHVVVGPRARPKEGRTIYASGWYEPPFRDRVPVAAVRRNHGCATAPIAPGLAPRDATDG
jgi:hypothetical protein